ncbi:MAG: 16S rRNA (guanine(966)-N(2))-methyltransferase RsmD [Oscillospiraceae bacterium]|nr:16S rRNA (guanine(966)-N(2))-methyltransferase RsmD [Oscillospiraceae bacterium]MCR4761692.1 16S rRNA (guanine(966)-N(2))-methyltransferase RsmD [Oscillospiraceae bacterium]
MRVITGSARGRRLITPEGLDTRPTTDKVKEAICSSLQFDFPGANVLDLFAGSGQMAIEALSRGARRATFIDADQRAIECIRQNVKNCRFADSSVILRSDAVSFLQRNHEKFDIAFLDPPYRHDTLQQILPLLAENMQENGIIVCEHEPECNLPQTILHFDLQKQKKYGKIIISVYRNADDADDEA